MPDGKTGEERELWLRYSRDARPVLPSAEPSTDVLAAYFENRVSEGERRRIEAFLATMEDPTHLLESGRDGDIARVPPGNLVLRAKSLVKGRVRTHKRVSRWRTIVDALTMPLPSYGFAAAIILLAATGGFRLGIATFEYEQTVQASIDEMLSFGAVDSTNRISVFN